MKDKNAVPQDASYSLYNLLMLAFNSAPMAITIYKTDFTPLYCNDEAVRMFGYKNKPEYFKYFQTVFPEFQPDGRKTSEIWNEKIKETLEFGHSMYDGILRRKDKTDFYAKCEYLCAKILTFRVKLSFILASQYTIIL
jgi:PAS domain-containing protein